MLQLLDVQHSIPLISKSIGFPTWSMKLSTTLKKRPTFSCLQQNLSSASIPVTNQKHKVIIISGPTGSGKTRLATELARKLNGEIISADSVQVYRGLDIGSAKPSIPDRQNIPHHLIDILEPSEEYSAGQFFEDARKATKEVLDRGNVPIITGGTGLYLRWFVYGRPDVPKPTLEVSSQVFMELEEFEKRRQWDEAVEYVVNAGDPRAPTFPYNNWYRLRRSLEVIKTSGSPPCAFEVPYDSFKEEPTDKDLEYDYICLFLSTPRINLYRAIDLRCEEMLMEVEGLLSEASWLLDMGFHPNMNSATRAIGYRQAMEFLLMCREEEGRSCPENFHRFLSEFQKASRNFAKRQLTWFRNEKIYNWIDASRPLEKIFNFVYDAYCDQREKTFVPESLQMMKNVSARQETYELKSYRTKNRIFTHNEACYHILDWVRRTQKH